MAADPVIATNGVGDCPAGLGDAGLKIGFHMSTIEHNRNIFQRRGRDAIRIGMRQHTKVTLGVARETAHVAIQTVHLRRSER